MKLHGMAHVNMLCKPFKETANANNSIMEIFWNTQKNLVMTPEKAIKSS